MRIFYVSLLRLVTQGALHQGVTAKTSPEVLEIEGAPAYRVRCLLDPGGREWWYSHVRTPFGGHATFTAPRVLRPSCVLNHAPYFTTVHSHCAHFRGEMCRVSVSG